MTGGAFHIIGPLWSADSPDKDPVMQRFDVFFIVNQEKLSKKQSRYQRFEMPWRSCNVTNDFLYLYMPRER